jgi:hypothetical protein
MEDFTILLAYSDSMLPLEVFDQKYLVEYSSSEIWLSEVDAWLPSDVLKFYTNGSLFEGRGVLEFFFLMTGKTIRICSGSRAALLKLS